MGIVGRREGLTGSELMRLTNTFGNLPILSQIVMTVLVKIEITRTIHHRVSIHILCSFITILALSPILRHTLPLRIEYLPC